MLVGIIGGTGPLGAGLGLRLAAAGSRVLIGSRDPARADEVVSEHLGAVGGRDLPVKGVDNAEAAGADIVVVATPWEGALPTVLPLAEDLSGRLVISVGNALMKQGREFLAVVPPRGSVAGLIQSALPGSRVAAACHHLPASVLVDLGAELDSDVLVCSDHPEATKETIDLLSTIHGLRGLNAGNLSQAGALEAFTAVLVNLNIRYKAHSTIKIAGF
jgi:8-hydroxy-5-deazaflavin:NADPH oxidoreductase